MAQVAQMLGVEFGEEFGIENDNFLFKLDDEGIYFLTNDNTWEKDYFKIGEILSGNIKILKKILDDDEKEYIKAVIKPFKNKVVSIAKYECIYVNGAEYIDVNFYDDDFGNQHMEFPIFKKGTMYRSMETDKEYSLEDLRL